MSKKLTWIVVGITVLILIAAQAQNVNAVMIDGHGWIKLNKSEKENYLKGYWDGVIGGIGQGVRFAMDTRMPDEKVFKEAYDLWANVGITTLLPKIDSYYSNRSKRKMMVMHAITQILVEMKLKQLQNN
jgi:hypothetical protein